MRQLANRLVLQESAGYVGRRRQNLQQVASSVQRTGTAATTCQPHSSSMNVTNLGSETPQHGDQLVVQRPTLRKQCNPSLWLSILHVSMALPWDWPKQVLISDLTVLTYAHMHKLITVKGVDQLGSAQQAFLSAQPDLLDWQLGCHAAKCASSPTGSCCKSLQDTWETADDKICNKWPVRYKELVRLQRRASLTAASRVPDHEGTNTQKQRAATVAAKTQLTVKNGDCYQSRLGDRSTAWRPTGGAKTYLAEAMQSFPLALHITCLHGLAVARTWPKQVDVFKNRVRPYRQRRRRSSLMYPNLLHRMRICRQTPTCGGACISSVRFLPNMLSC